MLDIEHGARIAATRPATGTVAIATARWRHRWASTDTCSGPNRCPDRVDARTSAVLNPANVNAIMMFTGSVKDDYGRKLR
jgi:hypothetical protein